MQNLVRVPAPFERSNRHTRTVWATGGLGRLRWGGEVHSAHKGLPTEQPKNDEWAKWGRVGEVGGYVGVVLQPVGRAMQGPSVWWGKVVWAEFEGCDLHPQEMLTSTPSFWFGLRHRSV